MAKEREDGRSAARACPARIAQGPRAHAEERAHARRAGRGHRRLRRELHALRQPRHPRLPQVGLDRLHGRRVERRRRDLQGHPRPRVHRLPGRLRHLHARPPPSDRHEGSARPAPPPGAALPGAARPHARLPLRARRHGHPRRPAVLVPRQLGHRSHRGRAQVRQGLRLRKEARPHAGRHLHHPGLPRQVDGQPERERQARVPRALPAAHAGHAVRALRRRRRPGAGAAGSAT